MKAEMRYVALDRKPDCRLYRVTSKSRIPDRADWPYCIDSKDRVSWWSDGKHLLLHLIEHTVRTARDVPKQSYIKLKETHHHWYVVDGRT